MTITTSQLDELERKARAARGSRAFSGRWFAVGPPWGTGTHVVAGNEDPHVAHYVVADLDVVDEDDYGPDVPDSGDLANHIAANSPDVTLALIARIRELERTVGQAADLLEAKSDGSARREWAKAIRKYVALGGAP